MKGVINRPRKLISPPKRKGLFVCVLVGRFGLFIQRAQYMLHNRMLQYIALPISEEPPHAIRAPDEGVVDLVYACVPFVETGISEFFPITIPQLNLTVESFFGS